jgi:short-subunit dehydrogenase
VLGLSESLYHELELNSDKVKVSVLCPELIKTGIATCDRNRPPEYSKPGDVRDTDARQLVMDSINEGVAGGIDPSVMADRVVAAIRSGTFYILSEDGWRDTANQRMDDIRAGSNPILAPPV